MLAVIVSVNRCLPRVPSGNIIARQPRPPVELRGTFYGPPFPPSPPPPPPGAEPRDAPRIRSNDVIRRPQMILSSAILTCIHKQIKFSRPAQSGVKNPRFPRWPVLALGACSDTESKLRRLGSGPLETVFISFLPAPPEWPSLQSVRRNISTFFRAYFFFLLVLTFSQRHYNIYIIILRAYKFPWWKGITRNGWGINTMGHNTHMFC